MTVAGRGRIGFEKGGSEFIGHVAPAPSVEAAEEFIESVTGEHADATHNVPAYRVSEDGFLRERANDDGEPTGSAGKPSLSVLRNRDLVNVSVVVTRYFGGTELGVGGLARAYAKGVTLAIDAAGVVERQPMDRIDIAVGYADSGTVRGLLEREAVEFEADYAERVSFSARVPLDRAAGFRDRLRSATSGRVEFED